MKMEAQIQMINVASIVPNKFQPRIDYDDESIQKLAAAIRIHGIVQPLTVRRVADQFEIITGERRLRAAKTLGITQVPCIICDVNDTESAEITVVENIHSKDLTAIEEAKNFQKILDKKYLTQEQLAERMGITIDLLTSKLNLLTLDEAVQTALQQNQISERHARSLLKLTDKMQQVNLLNEIIQNRLTVKQVDEKIDIIIGNYHKQEDLTGGIQVNSSDVNIGTEVLGGNDGVALTPTTYQYNSKVEEDESKNSIFFNNLENAPVTMEDPTLNFGFNPFQTEEQKAEDEMVDLSDEEVEELDEPVEEEEKAKAYDLYTPEELLAAINDLINIAKGNGVEVKTEDFDFTKSYQLIIKLPKESEEENEEGNN